MKIFKFLILSALLALLVSGCGVTKKIYSFESTLGSKFTNVLTAVRTTPGQSRLVTQYVDFYFAAGEDKYKDIPVNLYDLFISDAKWYASDGVSLQDPTLKVSSIGIKWKEGDTEYTVPGVRITIQVKASLDKSISIGQKGIYVELPNIKLIANAMGIQPKIGINPLEERILVSQINVHNMEYFPMLIIYVPIGVIVFMALNFAWNWLKHKTQK